MIIGVSIILQHGDGLLFEVQKSAKWITQPDGGVEIGIGCIGGGVEPGESPAEALQREAQEEIGCGVEVLPGGEPFLADDAGTVSSIDDPAPDGAALLWEVDRPGYIKGARVAVFIGRPTSTPRPLDLQAVLTADLPALALCSDPTLTFADLLTHGAVLLEAEPIPRNAHPFPVATPQILLAVARANPASLQHLPLALP